MVSLRAISGVLDILALFFTVGLLGYGFLKGYQLVELSIYNVYFLVVIMNQLINISRKI